MKKYSVIFFTSLSILLTTYFLAHVITMGNFEYVFLFLLSVNNVILYYFIKEK